MIYLNKETRDSFAKMSPVLQIICSEVEFELAKASLQAELIDAYENVATIVVEGATDVELQRVCASINKRYKRYDKDMTCVMPEEETLRIKCSSPEELSQVH